MYILNDVLYAKSILKSLQFLPRFTTEIIDGIKLVWVFFLHSPSNDSKLVSTISKILTRISTFLKKSSKFWSKFQQTYEFGCSICRCSYGLYSSLLPFSAKTDLRMQIPVSNWLKIQFWVKVLIKKYFLSPETQTKAMFLVQITNFMRCGRRLTTHLQYTLVLNIYVRAATCKTSVYHRVV